MPIYEYECPVCGVIEVMQKISDSPLERCPECARLGQESPVSKLISKSSFHLKGSGWYKTDYSGAKSSVADTTGGSNGAATKVTKESTGEQTSAVTPVKEKDSGGSGEAASA